MKNYTQLSDTELVALLKSEDNSGAFREIYNRYWGELYNTAYKRLKSYEIAEELVQDLFADLWLRRGSLNITTLLKAYLFGAMRYLIIKQIHLEMSESEYQIIAAMNNIIIDNSTEETIFVNDLYNRLQVQMDNLPTRCREVFDLSRNKHRTNKEIAHSLGITEKTVENQITRALRYLKTTLRSFLF
ncbi:RNA polymerase sigma-70 factor [Mucilaginibacter limnophilus]|uniref:RNA polymerase sigma-70 factor n=1 Tax=Mucilaginibacter limnophilus TaxID=1932778 RepID=A0A3S2UIY6_9SPHI|nr:RNA polymerase sigma-70 factor [Mucilaginibacter limnophilus]RVT97323.1 RNA polymerase sigma-70 factor [Mucilaginibacter limnophilus]